MRAAAAISSMLAPSNPRSAKMPRLTSINWARRCRALIRTRPCPGWVLAAMVHCDPPRGG